jgi:hypothetical protein
VTSPTAITDRAKARQNPSRVICIAAAVIAVVTLGTWLLSSPRVSPGGWGIYATETVKEERDSNKRVTKYVIEKTDGKTFWDWLELIGVPVTLTILGILFQVLERKRASQEAEEQRRLVAEENKEETLQRYFDRVARLLH